jgi:hypothetical protein
MAYRTPPSVGKPIIDLLFGDALYRIYTTQRAWAIGVSPMAMETPQFLALEDGTIGKASAGLKRDLALLDAVRTCEILSSALGRRDASSV